MYDVISYMFNVYVNIFITTSRFWFYSNVGQSQLLFVNELEVCGLIFEYQSQTIIRISSLLYVFIAIIK